MIKNAYAYLMLEEAKQLCAHFGFPGYLRIELAIAKAIGVLVLIHPAAAKELKEWAYVGFAITIISGGIAHLASGDPMHKAFPACVALTILLTSYVNYHKMLQGNTRNDSSQF